MVYIVVVYCRLTLNKFDKKLIYSNIIPFPTLIIGKKSPVTLSLYFKKQFIFLKCETFKIIRLVDLFPSSAKQLFF